MIRIAGIVAGNRDRVKAGIHLRRHLNVTRTSIPAHPAS
jgi:hypothetical protein